MAPGRLDPIVAVERMREFGLEPLTEYPGAGKPWKAKCLKCGTVGSPTLAHVQSRGGSCKECGRIRAADAKRLNPEAAAKLMREKGYEPLEPFFEGKHPWKCIHVICGNQVSPQYTNVAGGQGGCLYCGKIEAARKRRLDETKATNEMIGFGFQPIETYPGMNERWKCECIECAEEFTASLANARAGANPVCSKCNRSRMGKLRRVPSEIAIAEMQRVGLSPIEEFPGTHSVWRCQCNLCGQETSLGLLSARIRISKNPSDPFQGCEICVFKEVGASRTLDQNEAERRLKELNMRAIGTYLGTFLPIPAICLECGAENQVQLGKAFSKGWACTTCSLKRRSDSQRKPEDEARAEMLKAGFLPLETYKSVNSPWESRHLECGNVVYPRLSSIRKESGCSFCAKYGFDSTGPAILYFLKNERLSAVKIGITGTKTTRLARLNKEHGWEIITQFELRTGSQARSAEKVVLNWWREELLAPIGIQPSDAGILGGWTETAPMGSVSVEDTLRFIEGVLNTSELAK